MKKISINVLSNDELKNMLRQISQLVSKTLEGTFGPYGQNTLIQTVSTVYSTKDGWNVMQNLKITDGFEQSIVANAIKKLIQDVAQSVVLNAGDGTTTSIIAATKLNEHLTTMLDKNPMDSRTIENKLRECASLIVNKLQENATLIDDSNMEDIIYRIALVSTNWDEDISNIIKDIYMKTKNPIIKVEDSGTLDTYADYIEGYDLIGYLRLPNYYATSPSKGLYESKDPTILVFGSSIHGNQLKPLAMIGQLYATQGKDLVILAPTFDIDFLNGLTAQNSALVKMGRKPINIIPFQYYAKTGIDKDCVEDFANLVGARFISDQVEEMNEVFGKLLKYAASPDEFEDGANPTEEAIQLMETMAGTCGKLVATDKYILASDLYNKDEDIFNRRKEALNDELFKEYKKSNAETTLTDGIRVKRLRLGKMQCNMGIIKVGGFGSANLKAKKDAIDDATRACEVAYQDGYIVDGGIAIPCVVYKLLDETKDETTKEYLRLFLMAFVDVAAVLFNNRYHDLDKSYSIVHNCIDENKCYNLITEEYNTDIITPVNVCKEVINGCLRLVLVNATSNQFVFQSEDDLIRAIQAGSRINEEDREEDDLK